MEVTQKRNMQSYSPVSRGCCWPGDLRARKNKSTRKGRKTSPLRKRDEGRTRAWPESREKELGTETQRQSIPRRRIKIMDRPSELVLKAGYDSGLTIVLSPMGLQPCHRRTGQAYPSMSRSPYRSRRREEILPPPTHPFGWPLSIVIC